MTNYSGRTLLLKTGTWAGGTTIADCKSHSLKLNNEQVDVTNKSSDGYRTLLAGAGTRSLDVSLAGVVSNDAGFEALQGAAFSNGIGTYSMQWADGDTLEGSFAVTDWEVGGEHNGEQTFSATLQSSGSWTFTAA